MSPALFHLAILRGAAILVPEPRRTDWLAEWRSELWHVRREPHGRNVAAFCMGAFQDALWLRRAGPVAAPGTLYLNAEPTPDGIAGFPDGGVPALCSPLRCLSFLVAMGACLFAIAVLLPASRAVLFGTLYPRNLVMLAPAAYGDASDPNGFVAPYPTVSKAQFESLKARDASDFEDLAFSVPSHAAFAALPPSAEGFVLARLRYNTLHDSAFHFMRVRDRSWQLLLLGLPSVMFAFLVMAVIRSGSRIVHPAKNALRRSIFLAAKALCVLPVIVFGSLDLASLGGSISPAYFDFVLFGAIFAVRWTYEDQRKRCPVCLRLLANPVRIGGASRILLEWHGTELMCARGHGLLYVPEWPAIWSGHDRWLSLDPSWNGFFPDGTAGEISD